MTALGTALVGHIDDAEKKLPESVTRHYRKRMMTRESIDPPELETAIAALYRGPLEEFIARRDALVKQLRASGGREDAARVKALRKPSRVAWALDQVISEDPTAIAQLAAAITSAQSPSSADALRAALQDVRTAVRAVADAGARAAIRGGHSIDAASILGAVHAVIGDTGALAHLRAGQLVDIPEGGGLDILTAVTITGPPPPASDAPAAQPRIRDAHLATAHAELRRAESALTEARQRSQAAEQAVQTARAKLEAAEQRLQRATLEADACRTDLDRALQAAASATAKLDAAERAIADARALQHRLGDHEDDRPAR